MNTSNQIKQVLTQGQFTQAISLAAETLDKAGSGSEYKEIMYLLAVAYRLNGQCKEALVTNQQLLKIDSSYARAHQEIGHIHSVLGHAHEAAVAFYNATKLNPALLASWQALIKLYGSQGNRQAQNIAEQQVDYLSQLPKPILGARDLMYDGKLNKADQVCRQFLQTNKHQPDAMLLLAEIGIHLKIYGEAEFLLESLLAIHDDHPAATMELLKLYAKMGKFSQAKVLADKVLAKQADNPPILTAKASALVGLGQVDEAIEIYQSLLERSADQPGIQLLLGHALKAAGNFSRAIGAYQQAYTSKPELGDAYWSLANTKTYQFTENEVQAMLQHVSGDNISADDKIHMHFALGKAYEDKQDFESAFTHYDLGNQHKLQQIQYDPAVFERQVEEQIRHCDKSLFERLKEAGDKRADPIFIVGLPRAGSTLLEQILASHSKVDGTMELHNVLALAAKLRGQQNRYPEVLNELAADYFRRFGEQFLSDTQVYRSGAPIFIDKMPNNFVHIGLIKLMLPNAKIIDARREPMACCFSGFKQLFGEGQEFTYGLQNIGRYYNAYVKLMAHWDHVLPGFVLRVQHEDVIDDLEGQVRRILDFCGLEFEQACVDFHKTQRTIKTPSSEQVRQPIYRSGMQQWKHFEPYLAPLKNVLKENS